ncbi:unnamed protein product [Rotaria sp. Silwood2]|nr:unnamed protein product [Rotaria sp. Silwood2]CAF2760743.1 unnamed protein product [Rotaria sp. Silwood2]CAF3167700.1 unnamed protein product [Rotaria sp. Silwood2]
MMLLLIFWFFIITSVHGKCINETCVHGQCINDKCICEPGVAGDTCNVDIIDCDTEACLNEGTCIELINGFACQCLPNYDGPRCQYRRRTINNNHCKKKCLNNGKCMVIDNIEKCLCLSKYYGSECENLRDNNSLSSIRKCSVLKFRNNHKEGKCFAIGLTPFFDVHCECYYEDKNKKSVNCQITSSPYAKETCSFKKNLHSLFPSKIYANPTKPISLSILSISSDPITIQVCPVNWQILDQYEHIQEIASNVNTTRCELLEN